MLRWLDRLGECKTVNGITFKIVEVDENCKCRTILVEDSINNEVHTTTKSTWNKGKLVKLLREVKPKFIGEAKTVQGLLFKIVECAKNKFKIEVEGENVLEEFVVSRDVWKRGSFTKQFKMLGIKVVRKFGKKAKRFIEKTLMELMQKHMTATLLLNAPQESDLINELKTTYDLKALKTIFRQASKKWHPDMATGNTQMFKLADAIYRVRKQAIQDVIDVFGIEDEYFEEEVDLGEKIIKEQQQIVY